MDKDEKTQYMFVGISTANGLMVGELHKSEFASWRDKGKMPKVKNLRVIQAVRANTGNGTMLGFMPLFPIRSMPEDTYVSPDSVQIIGEVLKKDGTFICREDASLYDAYKNAVEASKAERAGISAPTAEETAKINSKVVLK